MSAESKGDRYRLAKNTARGAKGKLSSIQGDLRRMADYCDDLKAAEKLREAAVALAKVEKKIGRDFR